MNKLLTLTFALPLALAGCSGSNAKSCTTTTSGDTQTITCPDGTTATSTKGGGNGAAGATTLVSIVDEPAGTNCPYGGEAIETGTDTNNDGTLQSTEILSTSYVCQSTPSATDTITGSIEVTSSLQLAQLANVKTVTGTVTIDDVEGLGTVSLPSLQHVGGLGLSGNGHLTSFSAPALTTVDGQLYVNDTTGTLTTVDLPLVTAVGSLYVTNLQQPDLALFSHITKAPDGITLSNLQVTTLAPLAAAFATVTGDVAVQNDGVLTDVSALNALSTLKSFSYSSNAATALDLSKLTAVKESLNVQYDGTLQTISLPLLATVGSVYFYDLQQLASLSFPALTSATDNISINNMSSLTTLSFGMLASAGQGVSTNSDPALTTLSFPKLTTAGGNMTFYYDTALSTLDLPVLTSVVGDFRLYGLSLTKVELPKLLSVSQTFSIEQNGALSNLVLDSVTPTSKLSVGYFSVTGNPQLPQCAIDALYANVTSADGESSSNNGSGTCGPF